jgi:hypothetical protein
VTSRFLQRTRSREGTRAPWCEFCRRHHYRCAVCGQCHAHVFSATPLHIERKGDADAETAS